MTEKILDACLAIAVMAGIVCACFCDPFSPDFGLASTGFVLASCELVIVSRMKEELE